MATNLWTDEELKKAVQAYLRMLNCERNGTPYVKAEINRELQGKINRNRGSIEKRFQNISSILADHNLPYIKGYLPLNNIGPTNKEKIWQILRQLQNF